MFVYLSKKIAIPGGIQLRSIAWNKQRGYIACGGENGLLKVLKLDIQVKDPKIKGLAAPSTLSMNQTLDGHQRAVMVCIWNDQHEKLTTSDQNGHIIVWVLHRDEWLEEMINSRNKSVVTSMTWSSDGQKICIAYEDGTVIVGSVDGNRIWGKDFRGLQLSKVSWSPDGKILLFGLLSGEIKVFDSLGNIIGKVEPYCLVNVTGAVSIVGMHWYDGRQGYIEDNCPCLAICYDNGRCQVMRNETDDEPILIDTKMTRAVDIRWNDSGSILAVIGAHRALESQTDINVAQFFNPFGEPLFTLKLTGNRISSLDWEGGSLRIALGIDSFIYFANIRPDYKWGYCTNTVVYAFQKPDRLDHCLIFWEHETNTKHIKYVKSLLQLATGGDHCCLLTRSDEDTSQYVLVLCNAIEPLFINMSESHVIAASKTAFYIWQFTTPRSLTSLDFSHIMPSSRKDTRERLIHIDDEHPENSRNDEIKFSICKQETHDNICCVVVSDKVVVVGRESGTLHRYTWPHLELLNRYAVPYEPKHLSLNCTSSRLSIISTAGMLSLFDLNAIRTEENGQEIVGELLNFERKDVWNMKWSDDNAELFATMEKTRMYIFRNLEPEEPHQCSGYICKFNDLEVTSVLLDEVMKDPENPQKDDLLELEVKSLRDTRALVGSVGIKDAEQFVDDNPHPRLWRLLAEAALEQLNLTVAEHAFVRCKDYQGIELVKLVGQLQNAQMKQAEIAAYFNRFEEAESIYLGMDRQDLAIELRMKLGDWFRVVHLLKNNKGAVNDKLLTKAWNAIGEYYADRQKWSHAASYFQQSSNQERLVECYYMLENYDGLSKLCDDLPENHNLLLSLAKTFKMVGMCEQAVSAYKKANQIKSAIDTCVYLNQWDQAVALAKEHNVKETNSLLKKYASHLLEKGNILQAIELYRKANSFLQAAKLLLNIAESEAKQGTAPLQLKKMYVLAGLLVEQHKALRKSKSQSQGISSFLEEDEGMVDSHVLNSAWRGALAYHFYLMAQRQLYEGYGDAAMHTANVLKKYDDIIAPKKIYSILALASASNRVFSVCSQAFVKLESDESISEDERKSYKGLSMQIFSRHSPKDGRQIISDMDDEIPICVASGRPVTEYQYWQCDTCHHCTIESEIRGKNFCPLCHTIIG